MSYRSANESFKLINVYGNFNHFCKRMFIRGGVKFPFNDDEQFLLLVLRTLIFKQVKSQISGMLHYKGF